MPLMLLYNLANDKETFTVTSLAKGESIEEVGEIFNNEIF